MSKLNEPIDVDSTLGVVLELSEQFWKQPRNFYNGDATLSENTRYSVLTIKSVSSPQILSEPEQENKTPDKSNAPDDVNLKKSGSGQKQSEPETKGADTGSRETQQDETDQLGRGSAINQSIKTVGDFAVFRPRSAEVQERKHVYLR